MPSASPTSPQLVPNSLHPAHNGRQTTCTILPSGVAFHVLVHLLQVLRVARVVLVFRAKGVRTRVLPWPCYGTKKLAKTNKNKHEKRQWKRKLTVPCATALVHPNLVHPNLVRGRRPAHKVAQGTGGLANGHIYIYIYIQKKNPACAIGSILSKNDDFWEVVQVPGIKKKTVEILKINWLYA